METAKKVVLVPWDFTEGSEIALQHAIQLAEVADSEVMLLHIIPVSWWNSLFNRTTEQRTREIEDVKKKLDDIAENIAKKNNISPITMVLEGVPNRILQDLIRSANINLIVANKFYVFGKKQFESAIFFKNLSLKNFSIPFIIVEAPPSHSHYIEIVVPIDYDKKYKETLHWIIYLSKYYKCNINLIKPFIGDEGKKKDMASNIYFTKKMLDGNKIIYGIKTAKRTGSFRDEVFKFANNIEADLILIMADKYLEYSAIPKEINKSKIPLLCITPRTRKLQGFN